ncbi:MAG: response regulator transcription factor [Marinilabiliaceae bacterium]|nr:response regulator transcription factor [Marinilabiliaceae bacterium]
MRQLKIIVVDDNATFREGISFYLEEVLNYQVIERFTNGLDFLDTKHIDLADIVLMDIEMPKMNGIIATQKILFHHPHLKVIAVTNYRNKAYLKELILAGFKGCVLKDHIYNDGTGLRCCS